MNHDFLSVAALSSWACWRRRTDRKQQKELERAGRERDGCWHVPGVLSPMKYWACGVDPMYQMAEKIDVALAVHRGRRGDGLGSHAVVCGVIRAATVRAVQHYEHGCYGCSSVPKRRVAISVGCGWVGIWRCLDGAGNTGAALPHPTSNTGEIRAAAIVYACAGKAHSGDGGGHSRRRAIVVGFRFSPEETGTSSAANRYASYAKIYPGAVEAEYFR